MCEAALHYVLYKPATLAFSSKELLQDLLFLYPTKNQEGEGHRNNSATTVGPISGFAFFLSVWFSDRVFLSFLSLV